MLWNADHYHCIEKRVRRKKKHKTKSLWETFFYAYMHFCCYCCCYHRWICTLFGYLNSLADTEIVVHSINTNQSVRDNLLVFFFLACSVSLLITNGVYGAIRNHLIHLCIYLYIYHLRAIEQDVNCGNFLCWWCRLLQIII